MRLVIIRDTDHCTFKFKCQIKPNRVHPIIMLICAIGRQRRHRNRGVGRSASLSLCDMRIDVIILSSIKIQKLGLLYVKKRGVHQFCGCKIVFLSTFQAYMSQVFPRHVVRLFKASGTFKNCIIWNWEKTKLNPFPAEGLILAYIFSLTFGMHTLRTFSKYFIRFLKL